MLAHPLPPAPHQVAARLGPLAGPASHTLGKGGPSGEKAGRVWGATTTHGTTLGRLHRLGDLPLVV